MEIRSMAIALFYSIATAIGGISGPVLFGNIIGTGNTGSLFVAYLVGAGFMIFAAIVELLLGVRAEGKSLENVATPLTAIEEATGKKERRKWCLLIARQQVSTALRALSARFGPCRPSLVSIS